MSELPETGNDDETSPSYVGEYIYTTCPMKLPLKLVTLRKRLRMLCGQMRMDTNMRIEKYFSYRHHCFVMPRASFMVVFVICFMHFFCETFTYARLISTLLVCLIIVDNCYVRHSNYVFCYV
jgi:hypothetical protein